MAHRFKIVGHFYVDRKLLEEELHIVDTRPRNFKDLKIPCTRPPTWRVECLRIGFRTGPPGGQGHHLSTAQQMAIFLLLVDVVDLILAGGGIVTHDLGQDPVLVAVAVGRPDQRRGHVAGGSDEVRLRWDCAAQRRRRFSFLAHPQRDGFRRGGQHLHESPSTDGLLVSRVPCRQPHLVTDPADLVNLVQALPEKFFFAVGISDGLVVVALQSSLVGRRQLLGLLQLGREGVDVLEVGFEALPCLVDSLDQLEELLQVGLNSRCSQRVRGERHLATNSDKLL